MSLLALIETIERTALKQPAIAFSAGDSVPSDGISSEAGNGVFAFAQRQHAGSVELDGVSFGFSLYYIGAKDVGQDRHLEIQSTGLSVLSDILNELAGMGIGVGEYMFEVFNDSVMKGYSGVRCDVVLEVSADWDASQYV